MHFCSLLHFSLAKLTKKKRLLYFPFTLAFPLNSCDAMCIIVFGCLWKTSAVRKTAAQPFYIILCYCFY